jgi:hypothetical protein
MTMIGERRDGWLYVLRHPAWEKIGIVKIGMTSRHPAKRAAEITSVSGLIAPCTVAFCVWVRDRRSAELEVKRRLQRFRVRRRRELFRVSPEFAAQVVGSLGRESGPVVRRPKRRRPWFLRWLRRSDWRL